MQSEELQTLKQMFLELDHSKDGLLSFEELKNGIARILGALKAEANDWKELV